MDKNKILPEDLRGLSLIDLVDLYIEARTGKSSVIATTAPGDILDMIAEIESYIYELSE
jgi:hypothetical protein